MSKQQQKPSKNDFRLPFASVIYSGAWLFASQQLYYLGQEGWEWGTLGCFVTGGIALAQLSKAIRDKAKLSSYRRKEEKFAAGGSDHGKSRFANEEEIHNSKTFSTTQGVFLGTLPTGKRISTKVFFDGPESISIVAPPGEGKTTGIVIPTCLASPYQNLILNDPAGETYAICKAALEAKGYNVVVMAPMADEISNRIGMKVTDVGLDIFSSIHVNMNPATIRSQLARVMQWLIPDRPNMDEKSIYFHRLARMIVTFLALKELVEGRKPTLPEIRKHLMLGLAYIRDLFEEAEDSPAFGGVYDELAKSLAGLIIAAPQQFAGGYGIAEQALDIYDHFSSVGQHTASSSFDPSVLKDPHKKTALFLISGLDMTETLSPLTSMTLTYLFDMIAADSQTGSCTAIIDECGSLNLPLAKKLLTYRKANLRALMIWQDISGQAVENYGKAAMKQIMSASKLKVLMGLQEPEALEMFSKMCGTKSTVDISATNRTSDEDRFTKKDRSESHKGVPLMRPEEIRTMPSDQMLVIGSNLHPLKLNKLPYWENPDWQRVAGRSPYYRG